MANKLKKKMTVQKIVKKPRPASASAAPAAAHTAAPTSQVAMPTGEYTAAVGRRKVATARVRVYHTPGDFIVNGKVVGEYFRGILNSQVKYMGPFQVADVQGKHAVSVKVSGSGLAGQLDAVVHGVSRALIKINPDLRTVLKRAGFLTRDDRMKETRKIGTGGKARRAKQSPKR